MSQTQVFIFYFYETTSMFSRKKINNELHNNQTCDCALSYLQNSVMDGSSCQQVDVMRRAKQDVLQDQQSHFCSTHILW